MSGFEQRQRVEALDRASMTVSIMAKFLRRKGDVVIYLSNEDVNKSLQVIVVFDQRGTW